MELVYWEQVTRELVGLTIPVIEMKLMRPNTCEITIAALSNISLHESKRFRLAASRWSVMSVFLFPLPTDSETDILIQFGKTDLSSRGLAGV